LAAPPEGLSSMSEIVNRTVWGRKSSFLWYIALCSRLEVNRRFGEASHLHLQGIRTNEARKQPEAGSMESSADVSRL
jgi:hypothetical protein